MNQSLAVELILGYTVHKHTCTRAPTVYALAVPCKALLGY